ncbi:hypothetical protein TSMEX_009989 [Taenia solium]|eukprot:TsM_001028200 transcript=TsM_001028200 gene=TsM_001028200
MEIERKEKREAAKCARRQLNMLYEANRAADTMDGAEVESLVEETEMLVVCAVDSCIDVSEASAVAALSVLMDAAVDCEWI